MTEPRENRTGRRATARRHWSMTSPAVRVAVFGDLLVDEFIYGEIARVSREAPVLILNYDSTEIVPGGAGNAASNVAALGGRPVIVGLAGRDAAGDKLVEVLRNVDVAGVVRPRDYRTPTKTRILAGGVHSAKQQVVRIDRAAANDSGGQHRQAVEGKLLRAASRCDAMLVSDYGTGLVSPALVAAARKADAPRERRCSSTRATHCDRFRGITACTPNESEVEPLLGVSIGENVRVLERAGRELLDRTRSQGGARHPGQPRHGAVRARPEDPCTSPSTARTRSPTSPAPATPSSPP